MGFDHGHEIRPWALAEALWRQARDDGESHHGELETELGGAEARDLGRSDALGLDGDDGGNRHALIDWLPRTEQLGLGLSLATTLRR